MSRPALAVLALLAFGCASTGPLLEPGAAAREREAALERRVLELEKDAVRTRLELERLRRRVAELGTPLGAAPAAASAPATPAPAQPIGPAAPAPAVAPSALEVSDLDEPAATAPPGGTATSAPDAEVAAYEAALRLLRDGQAPAAESALAAFVAAHPSSDLADNAWFWIGEARLSRQDTAGAAQAFRAAIENYPNGNKTPDALYKLGHCLALAGDAAGATTVWRELVQRFPGTVAAERASARLGAGPGS